MRIAEQTRDDQYEAAYASALTAVAIGEDRDRVRSELLDAFEQLEPRDVTDILSDALTDAQKQGVEREDIDGSWFA